MLFSIFGGGGGICNLTALKPKLPQTINIKKLKLMNEVINQDPQKKDISLVNTEIAHKLLRVSKWG